ncbi:DNA-directed RNA polymerase II subunit RPB10/N [Mollivirus sibericum]|uniref:DNA-directed RNA polymerase II subunit RPB10/N n=1 Tax=Mollivirus sibericum TaxID=1678078 RepID=UPI0006B2ED9B|nr:DNA-directed RNA polymerase II subunit RPB10/N [Mollivirus sibericum]ALD62229.1 DNA-directed RNA polymerase II subunit RPB10/N [Mollivirus sibericum]
MQSPPHGRMTAARCFTCGKCIGNIVDKFDEIRRQLDAVCKDKIANTAKAYAECDITRRCCKRHLVGDMDTCQALMDYQEANELKSPLDTSGKYIRIIRANDVVRPASPSPLPPPSSQGKARSGRWISTG